MNVHSVTHTLAFIICLIFSLPVAAECEVGKSPVTIQTPSGKVKTLCVNDKAVQGIENASDHSAGTILPAACPEDCWTEDDLLSLNKKYPYGIGCDIIPYNSVCYGATKEGSYTDEVLSLSYVDYLDIFLCYNAVAIKTEITKEEHQACQALLTPYALHK